MPESFLLGDLVGATIDDPDGSGARVEIQGRVSEDEDRKDARRIAVKIKKFSLKPTSNTDEQVGGSARAAPTARPTIPHAEQPLGREQTPISQATESSSSPSLPIAASRQVST